MLLFIFSLQMNMKKILSLLFFLPLFSEAQDTCQLKRETDPFTHQTKVSTGFVPFTVQGMKLSISVDATPTEVDFFFWIQSESKCFDNESSAQVNYEGDRLKASFKNSGSMNCEGAFHFSFRNTIATPGHLNNLATKRISMIKLNGTGKSVTEINLNEEQRQRLMRMASCVVRESKSLIKQ